MRRRVPQILIVLVALALVVSAAGCGSKKSDTTTTAAASTTTESTSTDSTSTMTTDTTTTDATTTTATTDTTDTTVDADFAGQCSVLVQFSVDLSKLMSGTGSNDDIAKDSAALKALAATAPANIQADLNLYADTLTKVAAAYKGGTGTPDVSALAALSSQISAADFTKVAGELGPWAAGGCK